MGRGSQQSLTERSESQAGTGLLCLLQILAATCALSGLAACNKAGVADGATPADSGFRYVQVDPAGPRSAWGKAVGDLNGDGLDDIIVGGHSPPSLSILQRVWRRAGIADYSDQRGELVWYQSPNWQKRTVSLRYPIRTDVETGDIDGDGRIDIIALTDDGLGWFRNPDWQFTLIDPRKLHDVEVHDLDADGEPEIVTRSQSLFGYNDGDAVQIFNRDANDEWQSSSLPIPHGEGLLVSDIDGDGRADIVASKMGYRNAANADGSPNWQPFSYTTDPAWSDVFIAAGDLDGDGRKDIVLSPAEPEGQFRKLAWFQAPQDFAAGRWQEHSIDEPVEAVRHFVGVADFNGDGQNDVVTAAMNQGEDPDEIAVYLNSGDANGWQKRVIGTQGSHSMRILDANGDGSPDLFGANWHINEYSGDYPVRLWINELNTGQAQASGNGETGSPADRERTVRELWLRHVIDDARPNQATNVFASDLDGDGYADIVSGDTWYRNPGSPGGDWQSSPIGEGANNAALVADLDDDGHTDILASGWYGYRHEPTLIQRLLNRTGLVAYDYENRGDVFVWAHNDGHGGFRINSNIEAASGDFLQGAALLEGDGSRQVVLSWHAPGTALQAATIPEAIDSAVWHWRDISSLSQNEQLTAADVDFDGHNDLILGTRWLQYSADEKTWQARTVVRDRGDPDRHAYADINGDGIPDIVVGYEAVSRPGLVAWYESSDRARSSWLEHAIAEVTGPMSLSATDIDKDGDLDIVVGEHNLDKPETARLLWFDNLDGGGERWAMHVIHTGDEHHDGAVSVDIDNDGDMDVVSIGWSHSRVIVYENPLASGN